MAPNREPVTEDEIELLREEMAAQREEIREDLAEDLGGKPEDYDVANYLRDQADERASERSDE